MEMAPLIYRLVRSLATSWPKVQKEEDIKGKGGKII